MKFMKVFFLAVMLVAPLGCGDAGKESNIKAPVGADRDIPTEGAGASGTGAKKAPKLQSSAMEN